MVKTVMIQKPKSRIEKIEKDVRKLKKFEAAAIHSATFSSAITLDDVGTLTYLGTISQGDQETQRNGNAISPISLEYRCHSLSSNLGVNTFVRYIIFQDNNSQGNLPTTSEVLASAAVNSMYAINNNLEGRFRILRDWSHTLTPPNIDGSLKLFKGKIKNLNKMYFGGTGATVADARAGGLFLLRITTAGANEPTSDFHWGLKFNP